MGDEDVNINWLPYFAIYFGNNKFNTILKMPSVLLTDYLAADLSGPDPWADDVVMFTPYYDKQLLLHEVANCRAVEALFKMCAIEYRIEERPNAEFMSLAGRVPLVSFGSYILTDLERISAFFKEKGHSIGDHLTDDKERSNMRSFLSPIKILVNAELFFSWVDEGVYQSVTKPRYGSVFPFPLNMILPWKKRHDVLKELSVFGWKKKALQDVYKEINRCLKTFSDSLGDGAWLFGDKPTEVDALLYGHLFALRTSNLPGIELASIVAKYANLVSYYERIQMKYFGSS